MKRALLVALFFLSTTFLSQEALAQTVMTVSVGAISEPWNMSADDQAKFEAWVQWAYKCTPVPPAAECTPLTLAESESLWAKATLQGTADNVTKYQNNIVSQAAVSRTAPVGYDAGMAKGNAFKGPKGPIPMLPAESQPKK